MRRFPQKEKRPGIVFRCLALPASLAAGCALAYGLLVAALGFFPTQSGTEEATSGGIRIAVCGTALHSDFVLPARARIAEGRIDWTELFPPVPEDGNSPDYITIGWGHRAFFLATPAWSDRTVSLALRAAFGGPSALRVYYERALPQDARRCRHVTLSPAQYRALALYIQREAKRDADGRPIPLAFATSAYSGAFYEGVSLFHAFNTCNTWTLNGVKAAGLPAPVWTPLPYFILRRFP